MQMVHKSTNQNVRRFGMEAFEVLNAYLAPAAMGQGQETDQYFARCCEG